MNKWIKNIVRQKIEGLEKKNWFLKHHPNTIGKWWEWPFYYQILYIKMLSPEASVFQWWCHLFQIRLHDQIFTHHHDLQSGSICYLANGSSLQYQTKYDAKTWLFHLISKKYWSLQLEWTWKFQMLNPAWTKDCSSNKTKPPEPPN